MMRRDDSLRQLWRLTRENRLEDKGCNRMCFAQLVWLGAELLMLGIPASRQSTNNPHVNHCSGQKASSLVEVNEAEMRAG